MEQETAQIAAMEAYLFLKAENYSGYGDPSTLYLNWCRNRDNYSFESLINAARASGYDSTFSLGA